MNVGELIDGKPEIVKTLLKVICPDRGVISIREYEEHRLAIKSVEKSTALQCARGGIRQTSLGPVRWMIAQGVNGYHYDILSM